MNESKRKLKFWGWGYEDDRLSVEEIIWLEQKWAKTLGVSHFEVTPFPRAEDIQLYPPRLAIPAALSAICNSDHYERLLHSYGHSFIDSVRKIAGDFSNPPDVIAYPENEQDVIDLLDWCSQAGAAVIPFGGGTSVVGGVEPPENYPAVVSIDMKRMNRVLEVDPVSQTALIQAGATGPDMERQLKTHNLTLRHFPQSFQFATLGGMLVTRSGGHFATLYTHIDELVESMRVVTPVGVMESRRLPGSGAGPSPDRLWLGSEGVLGIVTQAWMRLRRPPVYRSSSTVRFKDIYTAARAVRAIAQADLYPANCRVLDAAEAAANEVGDGRHALLVLTFESADHPLEAWLNRSLELCRDFGGEYEAEAARQTGEQGAATHRSGAAGQWRDRFIRMPWFREELTARGIILETFETAVTWDGFENLHDTAMEATRLAIPAALSAICNSDHYERLLHSYGHSFIDSVRKIAGDFSNPPDVIAYPENEQDVIDLLDWCSQAGAAVIPFGGGTSVVGGVEPPENYPAVVSIDMKRMNRVLEVDPVSQTALIQAGATGPDMERQLKTHNLTLRHFPQSFQFATLGGMLVTRSGGHFATLYTHIDELVESMRVVTPVGVMESRRLPGSGAGPSPDRLWLGSEGVLGIVTQAWMRLRRPPVYRSSSTVRFKDIYTAARAVRAIAQADLYPANCRVLDAAEAAANEVGDGRHALLVLTFESADHPLEAWLNRSLELCRDFGGEYEAEAARQTGEQGAATHRSGAAGQWRDRFIRMPWFREELTARGIILETFETAVTWDGFENLHDTAMEATRQAVHAATGYPGGVSCRFTHVYPDGPAPYFTFWGRGDKRRLIEQHWQIKQAASDAVIQAGGTITHHHAVGRDHRQWYDRERPEVFAAALQAAKHSLDPLGLLNPGVIIDPQVSASFLQGKTNPL